MRCDVSNQKEVSTLKTFLICVLCCLIGYIVGLVNPSYLIAKHRGFDIRQSGSGNAGGSNALIMMGKKVGVFCMLFDIFKAYLCLSIVKHYFSATPTVFASAALGCELGHIFPVQMHFKGGKGLACYGGIVLAFNPKLFLIMLLSEAVFLAFAKYVCMVAITASAIFPLLYYHFAQDGIGAILMLVIAVIIFCKHIGNLQRIRAGREVKINFLWNRESEISRVTENADDLLPEE